MASLLSSLRVPARQLAPQRLILAQSRNFHPSPSSSAEAADPSAASSSASSSATPPPPPDSTTSPTTEAGTPTPSDPPAPEPVEEPRLDAEKGGKGFRAWLNGDGARFRHGLKGQTNWLGETPFPLNPTFSPLPPLSDALKTKIFNAYTHNILEHAGTATDSQVVRAVSAKFGVGMERVRAIVRLKELEKSWKDEGRALQTELLKGMESHLGVKVAGEHWRGVESPDAVVPRHTSRKTVFEMIDVESGDSSVFLPLLSRLPSSTTSSSSDPASKPTHKDKVIPATRPGRAATVFRDLSGTSQGVRLEATYDQHKTKRGNKRVAGVSREE